MAVFYLLEGAGYFNTLGGENGARSNATRLDGGVYVNHSIWPSS